MIGEGDLLETEPFEHAVFRCDSWYDRCNDAPILFCL